MVAAMGSFNCQMKKPLDNDGSIEYALNYLIVNLIKFKIK
jgi:hypothetical protein